MVRIIKTPLAVAVLLSLTLAVGQARAEVYYTFSGELPSDAIIDVDPNDPDMADVSVGDIWTVTLGINLDAEDWADSDPSFGDYPDAIQQAEVRFENKQTGALKYSKTFGGDTSLWDTNNFFVYDDANFGGPEVEDLVNAQVGIGDLWLEAWVSTPIDIANPLDSDALPVSTQITHAVADPDFPVFYFGNGFFGDDDYWEISYLSSGGETFQAVPEPSAILLWCFAAAGLGFVGWRKRRAA